MLLALPPAAVAGALGLGASDRSARDALAAAPLAAAVGVEAVGCTGPEGRAGARGDLDAQRRDLQPRAGGPARSRGIVGEKAGVEHRHA